MNAVLAIPALLPPLDGDDEVFLDRARLIVRGIIRTTRPASVYTVRIDNWFGEKWLGFELSFWGAGFRPREEREPQVIPPFVPSRVKGQCFLARTDVGYEEREAPIEMHCHQRGTSNGARKLEQLLPGSLIVWISGRTLPNGRGSMMAYIPFKDGHTGWHAEMSRNSDGADWSWAGNRGIDAETLRHYQERGGP